MNAILCGLVVLASVPSSVLLTGLIRQETPMLPLITEYEFREEILRAHLRVVQQRWGVCRSYHWGPSGVVYPNATNDFLTMAKHGRYSTQASSNSAKTIKRHDTFYWCLATEIIGVLLMEYMLRERVTL